MPPLRVFNARDTGVATMAWSAVQDRQGILHFGCDTVVSFDGDRWRPERMDPTYAVRGLDIGPNGRIWAAGVNQIGWFDPGPDGGLQYHSLMPRLAPGSSDLEDVWRVYAEGEDSAVFVAREKILRWDGRSLVSWDYPGMHLLWSTRTARAIYVHYPPLGLLRMGPNGPVVAVKASVIGAAEVRWLDDSGPDLLLLTSQGFKAVRGESCVPLDTEASAFARAYTPTCVARLGDGSLAVGTLQGGIAIIDASGGVRRVFNLRSGLPANQIYSLLVDRDGALWGMGPSQIVRLGLGSGTAVYGPRSGYPPGGCASLAEYSGSMFVVSHSDILRLSPDPESGGAGKFAELGISSSRFFSLLSTPRGLAVGYVHGLGLWTPSGMGSVIRSDDLVFRTSPSQSRPDTLLASLFDRVVSVDPATGRSQVVADSLPDYGDSVVDEASGRTWIGTPSRGLFVAGPGSTRAVPAGPRFGPFPAVGTAWVTRSGPNVIALVKGAAYFLEPGSDRFRPVEGFPARNPSAVSNADSHGAVWAALDPGLGGHTPALGRISVAGDRASWIPLSVEGLSAIGSLLALQVVSTPGRDELWMAGTEGLLRAGPEALSGRPAPRRPLIRAWVNTGGAGSGEPVTKTLPYATAGLHVEYSSLDYGMRDSERFQTMLGGAETQWSSPTEAADRDLPGLREGKYDLGVRLLTDSGVAGEPATIHFEVAPPWWRAPAPRAAMFAAFGMGILLLLRLRTRSLERRALYLEDMVRRRTEELEKANAAKTEFVADVSHEIRNPMGGILASARELSQTALAPEQQAHVDTLQSCATFLASLVEDVLDLAAIEAGSYSVARAAFSPGEVLEEVARMLGPRAGGARMDAAVDPALPGRIMGDKSRIQQVIVNFAVNAIKFGGRTIGLAARADGGEAVFSVADDGPGIPQAEQAGLFVRFSRAKPKGDAAVPGSGLGLAVCRALAERMGGSVGFTTAPDRGSTFFLRIPLEAGGEATPAPRLDACGARALVVEDESYNARALGEMLREFGYAVDFAGDGEEALSRLASGAYAAVFLDCDLPLVDGLEVARRFRGSEPRGRRTFIVATTALSTAGDRAACTAAGMDAFVTKPVTPEKLRGVLAATAAAGRREAMAAPVIPGLDLGMILRSTDGSAAAAAGELAQFVAALDEAMRSLEEAGGARAAAASAAHRILSLARIVGATGLAGAAADVQEYASVYTEAELAAEIAKLKAEAGELRSTLSGPAAAELLSSFPGA
jgi:signal transduction histidine kinase/DNA-binding response OmpR family regulator